MENYSKLFGGIIGALVGYGVTKGFLPAEFNSAEGLTAITTLTSLFFMWAFPANKEV